MEENKPASVRALGEVINRFEPDNDSRFRLLQAAQGGDTGNALKAAVAANNQAALEAYREVVGDSGLSVELQRALLGAGL
jgi:hypothetical protein